MVNCTNCYEKKEIIPELVQLAKFSKQHVPEQHPKDKKDFVVKRVKRLLKAGVTSALSVMVNADNSILTDQTKEMMSRYETSKKDTNSAILHFGFVELTRSLPPGFSWLCLRILTTVVPLLPKVVER